MFKQLQQLMHKGSTVMITVAAANDETLRVTVLPRGEFKDGALSQPLMLEGSAEELDAQVPELLAKWHGKRVGLAEQAAVTFEVIEAAKKAKSAEAAKALKAGAAAAPAKPDVGKGERPATVSPTTVTSAAEPVSLF